MADTTVLDPLALPKPKVPRRPKLNPGEALLLRADEAKAYGYDVQPEWKLKLVGGEQPNTDVATLIPPEVPLEPIISTPETVPVTAATQEPTSKDIIDLLGMIGADKGEGQFDLRKALSQGVRPDKLLEAGFIQSDIDAAQARLQQPPPPPPLQPSDADTMLRQYFPEKYEYTTTPGGNKISGMGYGFKPEQITPTLGKWLLDWALSDRNAFNADLKTRGITDSDAFLSGLMKLMGLPDESIVAIETGLDLNAEIDTQKTQVNDLIKTALPSMNLDIESLDDFAKELPEEFIKVMQTGGRSKEKQDLLRLMGYSWEDIGKIFSVSRMVVPIDGIRKLVTITSDGRAYDDKNQWVGSVNPVTKQVDSLPEQSKAKDVWDAIRLAATTVGHSTKSFFLNNVVLDMLYRDLTSAEAKIYGQDYVTKTNNYNRMIREKFQEQQVAANSQFQDWVVKHPELVARKDYAKGWGDNPALLKDPWYWAYEFGSSAPFSIATMGVTLGVTAITRNPAAGIAAGMAIMTPTQAYDAQQALLQAGATDKQATAISLPIALIQSFIEVAGDIPAFKMVAPKLFGVVQREITEELARKTLATLLKKGLKTFTIVEITEALEEVAQQAVQNAAMRAINANQNMFEGLSDAFLKTLVATAPFGLVGAGTSIRPDIKDAVDTTIKGIPGLVEELKKNQKGGIEIGPEEKPTVPEVVVPPSEVKGAVPAGEVEPVMAPGTTVQTGLPGMEKPEQVKMFEEGGKPGAKPVPLFDAEAIKAAEAAKPLPGQIGFEEPVKAEAPAVRTPEQVTTEYEDVGMRQSELQVRLESIQEALKSDPIAKYRGKVGQRTTALTQILKQGSFPETVTVAEAQMLMQNHPPKASEIVKGRVRTAYVMDQLAQHFGMTEQELIDGILNVKKMQDETVALETQISNLGEELTTLAGEMPPQVRAEEKLPTEEEIPFSESLQAAYDEIRTLRQQKATTEKVKESLVKMIRKHLPLPRQGELLAKVKNVKTEAQLAEAIARVAELAEAQAEKTIRTDIIRELKKTAPRVEKGITVGRLTPEVQPTIDKLRASLLVGIRGEGGVARNVEAYEAARAKIEQNIADYQQGKITWDALLEANEELKYTGMFGMSSTQLQEALDYIQELKRLGKDLRKIKREEIKEQRKEVVDSAVTEITGGAGIKPGVGTLRNEDIAGTKKVLDQPVNSQYGLVNLLDKLGKFAKGTKQYKGFLMRFANLTQRAVNTESMERERTFKQVRDKFREIYKVSKTREATRLLTTLSNEDVDLGTFKITTKEGVQYLPVKLTRAEMMEAYQLYKNPKNLETFKEGMHWTPEIMTKIVNTLTEQDIAWADWLQNEFYDAYYDKINPFYREEFNIDMPKNPDYVPQSRDFDAKIDETDEVQMLLQDQKRYASVTNKSLKARQANIRPFKFKGVFTVLTNHIVQMEHFMAWAETMHELRSTFGNNEVRTAIRQYHSNDILKRLDDYMNDFARGGVDRTQFLHGLDKLRSNFAVSVLAIKPSIGLQQIWTIGAFMTEMDVKDFVTGMGSFWKNPVGNYKWMMENSAYLKNRYSGGNYERDIRLAQQQGVAKTLSGGGNISQWLLWQVTQGDKLGVMPGWWAKYQAGLKAGLGKTDAMVEADLAAERTQNTSELASLSWLQRGSSFGKLLTMFQSQPNKYFRIIADNIRNMQYGRQSKVKGISNLFIVWAILPMLFQFVGDAFKWKKEKQARVLLLGPLNNILVAGQLVQSAWGWFTDDSFDWQASPVLSTVRDFQNFASKLVKIAGQMKNPYEDVVMDDIVSALEFFSKGIGQIVGTPTPYFIMVERAIRDGDPRELVFSRWALEEPKPDLQGKTAKIVGQLGRVVEDITDLPVDKKPPVYDTGKAFSEVKQALSKTLLSDVTEKKGFSPQVVAIAQAIIAQDTLDNFPNKRLFKIIDDIESDNTLNYTFSQYYMDYQDRAKITSLAKLKKWDDEHPRYNLGNVTPTQYVLMRQYESLDEAGRKEFLAAHLELKENPYTEWLKSHPEENAKLAIWGKAKLLTQKAYDNAVALIKELDIPDSALPEKWPPAKLSKAFFEYNDTVEKYGSGSPVAKLLRVKNPELNKWMGLPDIKTPLPALEIDAKNQDLNDEYAALTSTKAKDEWEAKHSEWVADQTRIEAYNKQYTFDNTVADKAMVEAFVKYNGVPAGNEAFLYRVDDPQFDKWGQKVLGWQPIDKNVDALRLQVKNKALQAQYDALDTVGKAKFKEQHKEFAADLERVEGYNAHVPKAFIETYVKYQQTTTDGQARERLLQANPDYYSKVYMGILGQKAIDFTKITSSEYDSLKKQYDTLNATDKKAFRASQPAFVKEGFKLDALNKGANITMALQWADFQAATTSSDEKKVYLLDHPDFYKYAVDNLGLTPIEVKSEKALRLNVKNQKYQTEYNDILEPVAKEKYLAQHPEFADDRMRITAYNNGVPDSYIEDYVVYKKIPTEGYAGERWLKANQKYYKDVYLGIFGFEKIDFTKVPTEMVERKYKIYQGLPTTGTDRDYYRWQNPYLDDWLVLKFGYKRITKEPKKPTTPAPTTPRGATPTPAPTTPTPEPKPGILPKLPVFE